MDIGTEPTQRGRDQTNLEKRKRQPGRSDLWAQRGIADVYFQRENMVNFWTVMGGIATGALLTQLGSLEENIFSSRWYLVLFYISSILIIVNSWVQSAWGSLILRWPMTIYSTLIYFISLFGIGVQCLLLTRPAGWMVASSLVVLFAILNQFYFYRSGAWTVFKPETIQRLLSGIRLYFVFLSITMLGAVQLIWFPFTWMN